LSVTGDKQDVRNRVWNRLEAAGAVDGDAHGRIPNFHGAVEAAARLAALPQWQSALVVKASPDRPQAPARAKALEDSKTLYMAVPKLAQERPFYHLNPLLADHAPTDAATTDMAAAYAPTVEVDSMQPIDLVIIGCVAVNAQGARLGKGAGYADIEISLLIDAGLISDHTTITTTVHDLQVLDDEAIPEEPHDFRLDWIITPTRTIECPRSPRPQGLDWNRLPVEKIAAIPALAARRP
jgi:5-formyltetrahydrofolate cyclo-ligase